MADQIEGLHLAHLRPYIPGGQAGYHLLEGALSFDASTPEGLEAGVAYDAQLIPISQFGAYVQGSRGTESLSALARRLGVNRSTLRSIENDTSSALFDTAAILCQGLGGYALYLGFSVGEADAPLTVQVANQWKYHKVVGAYFKHLRRTTPPHLDQQAMADALGVSHSRVAEFERGSGGRQYPIIIEDFFRRAFGRAAVFCAIRPPAASGAAESTEPPAN